MKLTHVLSLLTLAFMLSCDSQSTNQETLEAKVSTETPTTQESTSKPMENKFVHAVYFWLKEPENAESQQAFETALSKLMKNSKYVNTYHTGKPAREATRGVVDASFTYSLLVTFDSAEDEANYQVEEAHLTFLEEAKELWEKVVVYDSM